MEQKVKPRRIRFVLPGEKPDPAPLHHDAKSAHRPGRSACSCKPEVTVAGPVHRFNGTSAQAARVGYHDLMFGEQFMIWSSRFWRLLHQKGSPTLGPLEVAFKKVGIKSALGPFDALMTILRIDPQLREMTQADLAGPLGENEKRFLFIMSSESDRMRNAVLSVLTPCHWVGPAKPILSDLASTLSEGGFSLPNRHWNFPELAAVFDLYPDVEPV